MIIKPTSTERIVMNSRILTLAILPLAICVGRAHALTLDTFDNATASGHVLTGSTWEGQITRNGAFITVGAGALPGAGPLDDNGWGWVNSGTLINAASLTQLTLTAARNAGHDASAFISVQFEDVNANTQVVTFDSSAFAVDAQTAQSVIVTWNAGFKSDKIAAWTLGGGDPFGSLDFRMSFSDMSLTAIPEPSSCLGMALMAAVATLHRRRRVRASLAAKL